MLSYITKGINNPWTDYDIKKYENEGSQRDAMIYNSAYNSRIILTEKNVFLCSIKLNCDKYQNFYLFAVKRNLFYFIMYVPQLEAYRDNEINSNKVIQANLSRLPLTQKCISSYNGSCDIDANISISDGTCFFIRVDANVEEFLFPKRGKISNPEILMKYSLMNNLYTRVFTENEVLITTLGKYDEKVKDDAKKRLIRMVVRKGIIYGIPALLGVPSLGALFDLDSLFGLGDGADLAECSVDADYLLDFSDLPEIAEFGNSDICDEFDSSELNDEGISHNSGNNISFGSQKVTLESLGGKELPATIDKEPGTSNSFTIKTSKGTINNVKGGTERIKIDGIIYKLPKLKG